MGLVFFSFKHRYREKELNNFLNTRIYGKYFIFNLGGPFKYFIAKILLFLRIGKAISCDGRPLFTDKLRGINFWIRGTILNIPKTLRNLDNNFVTVYHSVLQNNKIFQIYPTKIKKTHVCVSCHSSFFATNHRCFHRYFLSYIHSHFTLDSTLFFCVCNANKKKSAQCSFFRNVSKQE